MTERAFSFPSALAKTLEKLRENMIISRYSLNHIRKGERSMGKHIKALKPELERHAKLVQQNTLKQYAERKV